MSETKILETDYILWSNLSRLAETSDLDEMLFK